MPAIPAKESPPFKPGDTVKIRRGLSRVPLATVTEVEWKGKRYCESGWMVHAKTDNPAYSEKDRDILGDSNWFRKV